MKHRNRAIHKGEEYVNMYPCLRKWINQCVQCQARGYKPDMPDIVAHNWWTNGSPFTARYIRKHFHPLVLDERGLCEVCCLYQ